MIYLDNAATTGEKPKEVTEAVVKAMNRYSVNPGRGGYERSVRCAEEIYRCRDKVSSFFGADAPERVIFTAGCTASLNTVIKGIVRPGDHIVISSLAHNSVARPAERMRKEGAELDVAEVIFGDREATVRSFERLIRSDTRLVVCTHASNVTGTVLPIGEIGRICAERGVPFCVDAAQSAGILDINMREQMIDYLCVAPHKGLYAPMGTGLLIALGDIPSTLTEGGTGSMSSSYDQPRDYPERFESGTLNVPGIFGISAGIDFVSGKKPEEIYSYEMKLIRRAFEGLGSIPDAVIYSEYPTDGKSVPTLSFNIKGRASTETADFLASRGIAVRAGLHCAPMAHRRLGTLESGTVRICCSVFNSASDIDALLTALKNYSRR